MSDRKICDECQSEIGVEDRYWQMELSNEYGFRSLGEYVPNHVDIHDGACLAFFGEKRARAS